MTSDHLLFPTITSSIALHPQRTWSQTPDHPQTPPPLTPRSTSALSVFNFMTAPHAPSLSVLPSFRPSLHPSVCLDGGSLRSMAHKAATLPPCAVSRLGVWSGLVCSDLAWSGLVCYSQAWSGLVWSGLAWAYRQFRGVGFQCRDGGVVIDEALILSVHEHNWLSLPHEDLEDISVQLRFAGVSIECEAHKPSV